MLILIGISTVFAQLKTIENYDDSIGRVTKITYTDLLKKIFPVLIDANSDDADSIADGSMRIAVLFRIKPQLKPLDAAAFQTKRLRQILPKPFSLERRQRIASERHAIK